MALPRGRASDQEMRSCLDRVHAAATLLDPHARVRCAVSTETAAHHFDVLAAARNNSFAIRRGLDGADRALIEELTDLIAARTIATQPGRKRPAGFADLVILVGKDKIYAPSVRQLRLLGIPTWLIVPGRLPCRLVVSRRLRGLLHRAMPWIAELRTSGSRRPVTGPTRPSMPGSAFRSLGQPCTVRCLTLAPVPGRLTLDLAPGRGHGYGDAAAQASVQTEAIAGLVAGLGGRYLADVSQAAAAMSTSSWPRCCPGASCATPPGAPVPGHRAGR